MNAYVAVALGSALGGAARYGVGVAAVQRLGTGFPTGTLVVNVVGSLVFGFAVRWLIDDASPMLRLFLTTGFCGGFTTFSAFSAESLALLEDGRYGRAATYVALSLVLCVGAALMGVVAARELSAVRVR